MRIVAIIVTLLCCLLMFYVKREWKAAMLIMGAMTLTLVYIPGIPLRNANLLLQVAFLLSEWKNLPRHFKGLRHTTYLWILLLLVSFSALFATLTSPYTGIKETIKSELLFKYFTLAYAFWAVKDEKSLKPILRISIYCLIVLTFFGVLNYIDKYAIFVNAVTEGRTTRYGDVALGDVYTESDRFRVQSMFQYGFDYGYICSAIFLLHLHCFVQKIEKKKTFIVAALCCLFGIYFCGCRTVWGAFAISFSCYCFWSFKLKKTSLWFLIAVMAFVISYGVVPFIEEKVDLVTDMFSDNPRTSGSSLDMRQRQLEVTIDYLDEENEYTGQGKGYFENELLNNSKADKDLYGIESVIFSYILERGFVGLALWALFYVLILIYFIKHRQKYKRLTGLGASLLMLYLFFSIGTGELGSVYPTMLLFGFVFKAIEYDKCRKIIYSLQNRYNNETTCHRHSCL